eukprot:Lankesteria_metandrocarpae@DN7407_c0_g1_i1.p1
MFGIKAAKYGWLMDWDLGSFGIGLILSNRINVSIFLGAVLANAILKPILDATVAGPLNEGGWYDPDNLPSAYLDATAYTLFGSLAIMIVQGCISIGMLFWMLAKETHLIKRKASHQQVCADPSQFAEGGSAANAGEENLQNHSDTIDKKENPNFVGIAPTEVLDRIFDESEASMTTWVPLLGYVIFGGLCMVVMSTLFRTPWYQILVALLIIPLFAISNIQGVGRTDWDVASSYGKLIMFPLGAWNSGKSIIPALVGCTVTISGCSNSACLMQDFKTGYLLAASPIAMFWAQMLGMFWGCIVTPTIFTLLNKTFTIPSADPTSFVPGIYGPIYRTLAIVASGDGFNTLPKYTVEIAAGFVVVAILLNVLYSLVPSRWAYLVPEPTSLAIGLLVGAGPPFKFFLGGMVKYFWTLHRPSSAATLSPYVA